MKMWPLFVVLTVFCWGCYVVTIHQGQLALGRNSALRAFLFVGIAYFLVSGVVLVFLLVAKSEPLELTRRGVAISIVAGVLGAIGALGIVFAMKHGGRPIYVAPLVFAGAPIVNTLISMAWTKPSRPPSLPFYLGIMLAAVGAALVLRYKPPGDPHAARARETTDVSSTVNARDDGNSESHVS